MRLLSAVAHSSNVFSDGFNGERRHSRGKFYRGNEFALLYVQPSRRATDRDRPVRGDQLLQPNEAGLGEFEVVFDVLASSPGSGEAMRPHFSGAQAEFGLTAAVFGSAFFFSLAFFLRHARTP